MNKKIFVKIVSIVLVIFMLLALMNSVEASSAIIKSKFNGSSNTTASTPIKQIISAILDVVRLIGSAIAIIILMVIAGKYIMASAGERADVKKYAVNYVIGAIILFAASGILSIIQNFVSTSLTT